MPLSLGSNPRSGAFPLSATIGRATGFAPALRRVPAEGLGIDGPPSFGHRARP